MIYNEEEIAARNERIKKRMERSKAVMALSGGGYTNVRDRLEQFALPEIHGLFRRLIKAKPLTATQFYKLTTIP